MLVTFTRQRGNLNYPHFPLRARTRLIRTPTRGRVARSRNYRARARLGVAAIREAKGIDVGNRRERWKNGSCSDNRGDSSRA